MKNFDFRLGYDLLGWQDYGIRQRICTDISPSANSHMLICGMSGSGKSYFQSQVFARLAKTDPSGEFFFADYKGEDDFVHLCNSSKYYAYKNTTIALDTVYERLQARLSGVDKTRNPITLFWDEYIANILALINEDKKKAEIFMRKVSEILLMGRSKSVRLIVSCQRPDAVAFPTGSRLNFGVVVILGAFNRSTYEMLMPDHMDEIKQKIKAKDFGRGEGSVLLQGSRLSYIKVGTVRDMKYVKELCKSGLNSSLFPLTTTPTL
ncbi:MAG: type IV secretory system conjugative DNA transfer family protein [Oscillospiraceae bacterium]|nr:type IV secretory system conjugative DNA transfer family protein [Oscillospiraceae bacterium]